MLYVLFASVSEPAQLLQFEGILYKPMGFTLKGYEMVLSNPQILKGYENTLFYVFFGTTVNLLMTSVAAYTMSRKNLLFGKPIMILIVFTMYFSGGMIPTYMVIYGLGLKDSIWSVILPWAILSFYLLLFKTFYEDIPDEIMESASIDGANDIVIFFRIVIPMSTTIMASVGLFYAIDNWNNFTNALLYLYDPDKFPLALVLRNYLVAEGETSQSNATQENFVVREAIQSAMIIISLIPIMMVYPFLQKYFTKGVMLGAVKG